MKLTLFFASFVVLAAATPIAPSDDSVDSTSVCSCPRIYCPQSLAAECKCKQDAAKKCYQAQQAQGLHCPQVKVTCKTNDFTERPQEATTDEMTAKTARSEGARNDDKA